MNKERAPRKPQPYSSPAKGRRRGNGGHADDEQARDGFGGPYVCKTKGLVYHKIKRWKITGSSHF